LVVVGVGEAPMLEIAHSEVSGHL